MTSKLLVRWLAVGAIIAMPAMAATPFQGLTPQQRWEIADSLDQGSNSAANVGDYSSARQLIDAALLADPSHYRSWVQRWNLLLRVDLAQGTAAADVAATMVADLSRVESGRAHQDQAYVLAFADGRLYELTGDSTYLARRSERLSTYLAEHPQNPRAFEFHVSLAKWADTDAVARRHFQAAQRLATTTQRRRAWSQAAIERGIERPASLGADDVKAVLTQWYSTVTEMDDVGARLREEANLVLWHGALAASRGDTGVVAHLISAYTDLRQRLNPYEQKIAQGGWQAAVGPLAIMDCRADALRGDLARLRGDLVTAKARYRNAWQHIAPLTDHWDRSRDLLSGPHLRRLRRQLLPYVE